MITAREVVDEAWREGLKPPPALTVSEWAESKRVLDQSSPQPGEYRVERTPYMREIMDCLSPESATREVDFIKGSQLGGTEASLNWLGYIIDYGLGNVIIALPSQDIAKEWSQLRVNGLINTTPSLQSKLVDSRKRDSGNATFSKKFGPHFLKFVWATSSKKFRSTPAPYLIADEVDDFKADVEQEGNPIALMRKRFSNFPRGKFLRISTPKTERRSLITKGFLEGDQRHYFVPCPHCRHYQKLVFDRLRWEHGNTQGIRYICQDCEAPIEERYKPGMLAAGVWLAVKNNHDLVDSGFAGEDLNSFDMLRREMKRSRHASFQLSSIYSPYGWYSWKTLAEDWEKCKSDVNALKVFVMTVLGETWKERGEAPDWKRLHARAVTDAQECPDGLVPMRALFLTAAVDVQQDRLEVEIKAWGRSRENWSIAYEVIRAERQNADGETVPCRTSEPEAWRILSSLITAEWDCDGGGALPIMAVAIDTGYSAQTVYDFCAKWPQPAHGQASSRITTYRTVFPVKGGHSTVKLIEGVSTADAARKRDGLRIVSIGVSNAKQTTYDNLRLERMIDGTFPPGYCHFPASYREEYYKGLTAETRIVRQNGEVEWRKDGRNEPLDLHVYNYATADLCSSWFREEHWREMEKRRAALTVQLSDLPDLDQLPDPGRQQPQVQRSPIPRAAQPPQRPVRPVRARLNSL